MIACTSALSLLSASELRDGGVRPLDSSLSHCLSTLIDIVHLLNSALHSLNCRAFYNACLTVPLDTLCSVDMFLNYYGVQFFFNNLTANNREGEVS